MYYIRRDDYGVFIKDEEKEYLVNTGIKQYINNLCMNNLSTFEGRKKAVSNLLKQKNNIPIYIDNEIFLYPTKSLREYDMLFINYYAILSTKRIDSKNTLIIFKNLEELIVNISIRKVMKQHKRIELIIHYFKNIN